MCNRILRPCEHDAGPVMSEINPALKQRLGLKNHTNERLFFLKNVPEFKAWNQTSWEMCCFFFRASPWQQALLKGISRSSLSCISEATKETFPALWSPGLSVTVAGNLPSVRPSFNERPCRNQTPTIPGRLRPKKLIN